MAAKPYEYICPKCRRPVSWIGPIYTTQQDEPIYALEWNCRYCGEMIIDFVPMVEYGRKELEKLWEKN